jgi:hypothetical protein
MFCMLFQIGRGRGISGGEVLPTYNAEKSRAHQQKYCKFLFAFAFGPSRHFKVYRLLPLPTSLDTGTHVQAPKTHVQAQELKFRHRKSLKSVAACQNFRISLASIHSLPLSDFSGLHYEACTNPEKKWWRTKIQCRILRFALHFFHPTDCSP